MPTSKKSTTRPILTRWPPLVRLRRFGKVHEVEEGLEAGVRAQTVVKVRRRTETGNAHVGEGDGFYRAVLALRSGSVNTNIALGAPGCRPPPTGAARNCRPPTA